MPVQEQKYDAASREYEAQRHALFFSDVGSRALYKEYVRCVLSACVCPSVLSVCLPACLSVRPSVLPSVSLSVRPSGWLTAQQASHKCHCKCLLFTEAFPIIIQRHER
jgi:hypothetical protein